MNIGLPYKMEKGRSRPLSFKFRNSQITPDLKVIQK